jgi:predicted O-methyltransferase YrrM
MTGSRNELPAPAHVQSLLAKLHKQSINEEDQLRAPGGGYETIRTKSKEHQESAPRLVADVMRDKFIALDEDKALFVYHLIRTIGALNVVEAGTSFGVSTIYLATAVGQNAVAAGKQPSEARVIATEHEPTKAAIAKKYWKEAGSTVEPWIDLREGDAVKLLQEVPPIDFVLLDSM